MNRLVRFAFLAVLLAALSANASNEAEIAKAKEAAQAWLALTDAGNGGESWRSAASSFRAVVPQDKWEQSLAAARGPLGALKNRTVSSAKYSRTMPGAPDGEYVVLQYSSQFANKASAVETITPMRDKDGSWKVSGYYVK